MSKKKKKKLLLQVNIDYITAYYFYNFKTNVYYKISWSDKWTKDNFISPNETFLNVGNELKNYICFIYLFKLFKKLILRRLTKSNFKLLYYVKVFNIYFEGVMNKDRPSPSAQQLIVVSKVRIEGKLFAVNYFMLW